MKKVFIIAEAGVNHNGSLRLAKKLIDGAAESGADAVKFQTWKTELLVTQAAEQASYQIENTGTVESQFDMLKKLELTYDNFLELKQYCDAKKILFMSTPDEAVSATFLSGLQEIFKVGSAEITNLPFLRHIGGLGKQIIISTGMAHLEEIKNALDVLVCAGTPKERITVLHATTEYPCPMNEVNLCAMETIRTTFGVKVGYSDHTQGIEIAIAAVAMGATIIEKHFTLDRSLPGPDHKASLELADLKSMISCIRNIEFAMGDGIKRPTPSESRNIQIVRKSIVASRVIKTGEIFSLENLTIKRPGLGISPMRWDDVIGKKAPRTFLPDEFIKL